MKVIPVAPISNKKMVLILFILPRLHATTRALSVNRLPGRLEAEIYNGFSLPTATIVGVRRFLPSTWSGWGTITSLTLTKASAESAFVKTNISCHPFRHFGQWSPTSLQVKQQSSRCNLAIFSQVSLVALLRAGHVEVGFNATEGGRLYTVLAGRLLWLACWSAAFVLMFVFVFVLRYQLPPKLAADVWSFNVFQILIG